MMNRCLIFSLMSIFSLAISGCGGGANQQMLPTTSGLAGFSIAIHVPARNTEEIDRRIKYVSASTASAKLDIQAADGKTDSISTNCVDTCNIATQVQPGSVLLKISLYTGSDATGSILATGTLTTTISQGQQNTLSVSLGGVISSLTLRVTGAATAFILGVPATAAIALLPFDAMGNQIIGTAPFSSPVTLSLQNNGANEFSISKSSIVSPSDTPAVLSFNGGSVSAQPTLVATVNGSTITASASIGTENPVTDSLQPLSSANAFIDSIGVNIHVTFPSYAQSLPTVISLLKASGIRHIREGLVSNPSLAGSYFNTLNQLASYGIHGTMITSMQMPLNTIIANTQAIPNFTEAIEAPNEYDESGSSTWAADLAAYQRSLYTSLKTSALSALPVIGPSLTSPQAYAQLGDLSAYMDQGNMHDYLAGFNPGNVGYGAAGFGSAYGSIQYNMGASAQSSGTKPIVATETGYCTVPSTRNAITPAVESKYVPRLFLEQWMAHVSRTIEYELLDENDAGGSACNGTFGLVANSLTPKPAYYAVQNLIGAMNDSGSVSTLVPLRIHISSPQSTVEHALFQKSDGSYVLALWNEVSGWDVNNGTGVALTPAPATVSLMLSASPSASTIKTITDSGTSQAQTINWQNGNATLPIDDHVTLVSIKL
jgi:hypothetical protein